jgi:hypothetical protein
MNAPLGCAGENNIAGIIPGAGIIFAIVMVAATWYNRLRYDRQGPLLASQLDGPADPSGQAGL